MRTPVTWIEKVTGLFVLVVLGLLVAGLFVTAQKHNVFGLYESHVLYAYLKGGYELKKGSPVRFADIEAGVVNDLYPVELSPYPDRKVKLELRIEGKFTKFIPEGTKAKIDRQIVGGTRIDLIPPTMTANMPEPPPLPNKAVVEVEVPQSLMEKVASLKEDVATIKEEVVATLRTVQKIVDNVKIVTDGLVTGKGLAGRLLQDEQMGAQVAATLADVRTAVADVKETLKNVRGGSESVPAATTNVRDATAKVNALMDELPKIVASLERTLADVEVIVANVREASGAVPEVARKTDKAVSEANRTIEAVQKVPPVSWGMPEQKHPLSEHEALPRGGPK